MFRKFFHTYHNILCLSTYFPIISKKKKKIKKMKNKKKAKYK